MDSHAAGGGLSDHFSPGGKYRLQLEPEEARNSQWIDSASLWLGPNLIWQADYPWSAEEHHWLDSESLQLTMRRFPGDAPPVRVTIRLLDPSFHAGFEDGSLAELNRFLESRYEDTRSR